MSKTLKVKGKEYKLDRATAKVLEDCAKWSKTVLPNPFDGLAEEIKGLPKEYADELFQEAKKKKALRGFINDPDFQALLKLPEGIAQVLWRLIKPNQPSFSLEDAAQLFNDIVQEHGEKSSAVLDDAITFSDAKLTEEQAERFFLPAKV